jgi:hypothetical protein
MEDNWENLDDWSADEIQQHFQSTYGPEFYIDEEENDEEYQEHVLQQQQLYEEEKLAERISTTPSLPELNRKVITHPSIYFDGAYKPTSLHYDNSGYYSYILYDGSFEALKYIIEKLNHYNIFCPSHGRSYRPANDGKQYVWYIRVLDFSTSPASKPTGDKIAIIFKGIIGSPPDKEKDLAAINQNLQYLLKKSQFEKETIQKEIDSSKRDIELIQNSLNDLNIRYLEQKKQSEGKLSAFRKENRKLLDQVKSLTEQLTRLSQKDETIETLNHQLSELHKKIKDNNQEIDYLTDLDKSNEKRIEELKVEIKEINKEKNALEDEKAEISHRLEEVTNEKINLEQNRSGKKSSNDFESDLNQIVSTIFANLKIHKGSVSFLAHEVKNYCDALSVLKDLSFNSVRRDAKRIKAAKKWREIRFNTGKHRNIGRIYYSKSSEPEKYKYNVVISDKRFQTRDINKLSGLPV